MTIEVWRHFGNPKLIKIKGLKTIEMPECEGGGYAMTGEVAERIVAALESAGLTQKEATDGK